MHVRCLFCIWNGSEKKFKKTTIEKKKEQKGFRRIRGMTTERENSREN